MAKKKPSKITMQVKVSLPRAGEFIVGVKVDMRTLKQYFDVHDLDTKDGYLKEALQCFAEEDVTERLTVAPLKGELVRVVAALRKK